MAGFKKFIETGGLSLDEIKKNINNMVNHAVADVAETVADDLTQLAPKDVRKKVKKAVREAVKPPETERETAKAEKIPPLSDSEERLPNTIAYPHEAVPDNLSAQDEYMLEKIRKMRSLEEITRNNYIVRSCAEITMVRQGEFMADVEDSYERKVYCGVARPIYAAFSNSQLRTYFTWRTDVRRGIFPETDKPYVMLYCYELMNKIGVKSSDEAFEKLLLVFKNYENSPSFPKDKVCRWIKDFYAFNDISVPLPEDMTENALDPDILDIEHGIFKDKLEYFANNSAYDIKNSTFYSDASKPLLNGACEEVFSALAKYFGEYDLNITTLVCGKLKKDYTWEPFRDALVDRERQDGFHAVSINGAERYIVKRGEPTLVSFEHLPMRGLIGYILKDIEARLRKRLRVARKISANPSMMTNDVVNRGRLEKATGSERFEKTIDEAMTRVYDKFNIEEPEIFRRLRESTPYEEFSPKEIVIDESKLEEIRRKSDEIAEKLIISDEDIEQISNGISDDDFSEKVSQYAQYSDTAETADTADTQKNIPEPNGLGTQNTTDTPEMPALVDLGGELPDNWNAFAQSLTKTELGLLKNMLSGKADEYCRSNDIFAEPVFERINLAALDNMGDVVIENGEIIPDYADEVRIIADAFEE